MELRLMIDISDEFYFNFFLFLHFVGWMGFFRQVINLEFNALMFCKNKLNFCVFFTKHPSKYHIICWCWSSYQQQQKSRRIKVTIGKR